MYINEPRSDYLRLTTFDNGQQEKMRRIANEISTGEEPKDGQLMQYHGDRYGHAFWGKGVQGGYAHWMLQVSGELAETAQRWAHEELDIKTTRCTRIDLQVTVPLPDDWSLRQHADHLRKENWPNRRRKVEFYENEGQGGTIYIGSRQSLKFARLYVKMSDSEEWPLLLRFEIELKGDVADTVYKTLAVGAVDACQVLRGEFDRLPILETSAWLLLERSMPVRGTPVLLPRNLPEDSKTLRWLIHKVDPTIRRMLNSHEHGYRIHAWLLELIGQWEKGNCDERET